MAEVREVVCDVKGCTRREAVPFSVFSHRATDGAGSMEDWHHGFDLCPGHAPALLVRLLRDMDPLQAKATLDALGVETRLG